MHEKKTYERFGEAWKQETLKMRKAEIEKMYDTPANGLTKKQLVEKISRYEKRKLKHNELDWTTLVGSLKNANHGKLKVNESQCGLMINTVLSSNLRFREFAEENSISIRQVSAPWMWQVMEPRFKKMTFDSQDSFETWMEEHVHVEIRFEDRGQDLLRISVAQSGEIIDANLQAHIWNGRFVNFNSVRFLQLWENEKAAYKEYAGLVIKSVEYSNKEA